MHPPFQLPMAKPHSGKYLCTPPDMASIPEQVRFVLDRLADAGHKAFLVGGCVRDLLLSLPPADWDVCTSAHPDKVRALFPDSLDTGIQHGTVTALLHDAMDQTSSGRFPVEITTWRAESGYSDHRHPDVVRFSADLRTDLSRRDFTINAMAWNPTAGLVDLFGGQEDLATGIVRCVGDPLHRFSEDALRMLRAIRFCSQLGFILDPDAAQAIRHHRDHLLHVSAERIQYEMTRTLLGIAPSRAMAWWETGLAALLFPTLKPDISRNMPVEAPFKAWETCRASSGKEGEDTPDADVEAWVFLFLAGTLTASSEHLFFWMRQYRFPNRRADGIRKLLDMLQHPMPPTPRNLRWRQLQFGEGWVRTELRLRALLAGRMPESSSLPPPPSFLPEGKQLVRALAGCNLKVPKGKSFGDLLECLRMAACDNPMAAVGEVLPQMACRMQTAWPSRPEQEG